MIERIRKFVFKKVFEEWVPLRWVNNYKTQLTQILSAVATILVALSFIKPEWAPQLDEFQRLLLIASSYLGLEVSRIHRKDKEDRDDSTDG